MIDILKRAEGLMVKFITNLAARSSNKIQFTLDFGVVVSTLKQQKSIILRNGVPFLDYSQGNWVKTRKRMLVHPTKEPNPHIVISGMSGFGKSSLLGSLLIDIRDSEIPCIIFDAHDEHSDTVIGLGGRVHNALYSGINILELDGASVSERISELSRLFKEVYSLGYIQATKLSDCLWYTYRKAGARSRTDRFMERAPTVRELLDELNIFIRNSKTTGEKNTLLHLRDKLSLLNSSAFSGRSIGIDSIGNGLHSFTLGGMKSREARIIYIGELLNRLYGKMHDRERHGGIKLYVMIDEAQFLVDESSSNSVITKMVEEGRKYGVGIIVVTHAASTLNKKIMANCSVFMTFYAREPSELAYVSKVLSGGDTSASEAIRKRIGALRVSQAIMVTGNNRNPVVVSTPKIRGTDNSVGRSENSRMEELKAFAKRPVLADNPKVDGRLAEILIKNMELDSFVFQDGCKEEKWIMAHNRSISIEHEVYVKKIAELLAGIGIRYRIIDNSNGPDISAFLDGKRTAFEYETGSKSYESTKKMLESRLSSYDRIIIVVRDSSNLDHYRRSFGSERVDVVQFSDMPGLFHP